MDEEYFIIGIILWVFVTIILSSYRTWQATKYSDVQFNPEDTMIIGFFGLIIIPAWLVIIFVVIFLLFLYLLGLIIQKLGYFLTEK